MDGGSAAQPAAAFWRVLAAQKPDRSAHRTLTWTQAVLLGVLAFVFVEALVSDWRITLTLIYILAAFIFTLSIAWRLLAAAAALARAPTRMEALLTGLPRYTVICPLRREAAVLAELIAALDRIDYPRASLQILIVLEEDDAETRAAFEALKLAPPYQAVLVPLEGPPTKPKALNFALQAASGEFSVVYDAEDRPHPQQLRAALAAFKHAPNIACVQAPLLIDNTEASWISAQFAAEYAIQFGVILPFLAQLKLPMPLGGTSNHFRTNILREIGGWDSYNVTEDADLGYRLAAHGYNINVIQHPTFEEAPITVRAWINQRTRWIKGHLQTWLVLMRNPFRTYAELGFRGFGAMQLVLAGGLLAAFAHGPLALLLLVTTFTPINLLGPQDIALTVFGLATAFYANLVSAVATRDLRVIGAAATMPFYWPLTTIAAWMALFDLITRPHYWAKTTHGLSARPAT
ncbi:MAG: glycosyltransferase [Caulobacterales bacterium]